MTMLSSSVSSDYKLYLCLATALCLTAPMLPVLTQDLHVCGHEAGMHAGQHIFCIRVLVLTICRWWRADILCCADGRQWLL